MTMKLQITVTKSYEAKGGRWLSGGEKLYIGAHMANAPNCLDIDKNSDRNKYNYRFPGIFFIITLKNLNMGGEFMIDYQYNTDKLNPKTNEKPLHIPK